jgi:dUTPase
MNRFRFIKVRDVKSPSRGNEGDAGLDFYIPEDLTLQDLVKANPQLQSMFYSELSEPGKVTLEYNFKNQVQCIYICPFTRILIPSGIRGLLEPRDSMLMAANKSGISTKKGLIYTAEIVDSPYTGEIHIGVYNTSHKVQIIEAGTKLVQFIHVPIYLTEPEEVTNGEFYNDASDWGTRGNNGFGSTGINS